MIVSHPVADCRCTSCNGNDRVIEYKLGPNAQFEGGLLVRFCRGCRGELMRRLFDAQKADDSDLIARSLARNPPRKARR